MSSNNRIQAVLAASAVALALGSLSGQASALDITPAGPGLLCTTNDNTNFNEAQVEQWLVDCTSATNADLTFAYKANVDSGEEGPYADDYQTVFSNTPTDPAEATITWDGPNSIPCPECFMVVKDGNADPAQYLFRLTGWNGTDTLNLSGFWPTQGAISNVAIYSGETDLPPEQVPEPGTVALFGLGALALGLIRRRRS